MSLIPKNLRYGNRAQSAMARSYVSNIQPNGALNGYKGGTVATINIPTGPNLALIAAESVLKFTATTGTADGRLDAGGAHGYIQRIRIFHGSNLLEDTDNYGLLAKEYFDLQVSTDANYGKCSIMSGQRSDLFVTNTNKAVCINSGALVAAGSSTTYAITLLSILGSLSSSNYFPLFACTRAQIRLEIQFTSSLQGVGVFPSTAGAGDFTIDNMEYIASYIELSGEAMSIINAGQSGPLSYTLQGVRNYNTTQALSGGGSTTQVNFNIPAKFGSVKNIIASIRDTAAGVNTAMYFPHSCNMNGIQSYYFKIGSKSSIPAIAPSTVPQYFCELVKAVGSLSDLNHQPSIDLTSYSQPTAVMHDTSGSIVNGSLNSGSFYIGLDLENYAESDKSTIYTGYDTTNDDTYLVMNFKPTTGINSARFDAFVMFDQELVFENDTCYVQF